MNHAPVHTSGKRRVGARHLAAFIGSLLVISDQNAGGAIMMVEQSVLLVSVLAVLFGRMLAQSEQDELRRGRLGERAAAS